jgi:hypothetical protein
LIFNDLWLFDHPHFIAAKSMSVTNAKHSFCFFAGIVFVWLFQVGAFDTFPFWFSRLWVGDLDLHLVFHGGVILAVFLTYGKKFLRLFSSYLESGLSAGRSECAEFWAEG